MNADLSKAEQVTRTAYFLGLSPQEWIEIVKDLFNEVADDLEYVSSSFCEATISLLGAFNRDATLKEYLKSMVRDPAVPVFLPHVVSAFLKHVRIIQDPSTLDMICQLILELHYVEDADPVLNSTRGSIMRFTAPPDEVLGLIAEGLYLLRYSYEISPSPFHNLSNSASSLLDLLVACVEGDTFSGASTPQVTLALSLAHELDQIMAVQENIKQHLNTLTVGLSMTLSDSSRQLENVEMFANFQTTPSRRDTSGPNPGLDLMTGSLIMNRLVSKRATQSGSGCEAVAIANLIAWYRVSSPEGLPIFFAHVILSAIACLSQEPEPETCFTWRSFVLGRIPTLLKAVQERLLLENAEPDQPPQIDPMAMQSAIAQAFSQHQLLDQCEPKIRTSNQTATGEVIEEEVRGTSFRSELLGALISNGLLDHAFAVEILPTLPTEFASKLSMEAQEAGAEVDTFIESKFSPDSSLEDTVAFLERITKDTRSDPVLANVLCSYCLRTCASADIESLGRICKALAEYEQALEVMSLHAPLHDMVAHALACLEDYDLTTVGDPQTAVSHIGEVVLFLQSILARFRITSSTFHIGDRVLRSDPLRSTSAVYLLESLSENDRTTLDAWRKAIFDRNSEGIDDDILRSTKPQTLLGLSATLFSDAVASCSAGRIDSDALQNGVSYYMGPLLNWTLVGVVQALLEEVERASYQTPQHLTVLETILTDKSCPSVVLRMVRQQLLRLYSDPRAQQQQDQQPNMTGLVTRVLKTLPPVSKESNSWASQPHRMIHNALACADTGRVPAIDIDRCLTVVNVRTFFDYTWRELLANATIGKIEICRRFAAYLLTPTCPSSSSSGSRSPPLLPLFLHVYVPSLLATIDRLENSAEQTLSLQLLCTIIIAALTFSVHFERALLGHSEAHSRMHNLPSATMAKRLRLDLRRAKGSSSLQLFQKLSASSTFVSTFPSL